MVNDRLFRRALLKTKGIEFIYTVLYSNQRFPYRSVAKCCECRYLLLIIYDSVRIVLIISSVYFRYRHNCLLTFQLLSDSWLFGREVLYKRYFTKFHDSKTENEISCYHTLNPLFFSLIAERARGHILIHDSQVMFSYKYI